MDISNLFCKLFHFTYTRLYKFSLQNPHIGEEKVAKKMAELFQIDMTKGGVRDIWKKYGMQTIPMRVEKSLLNFDAFI